MDHSRRHFILQAGAFALIAGISAPSAVYADPNRRRYVMIHDENACVGCNECVVACSKTNHVPAGHARLTIIPLSENKEKPRYFRHSCQHCEDAPCIAVCPTGASFRDEDGIVRVNEALCIGCDYCIPACPYEVRYHNPITHTVDKCDFCAESRLAKGYIPICVRVCPENALVFGRLDSPQIQSYLRNNPCYQHRITGYGQPYLYRHNDNIGE